MDVTLLYFEGCPSWEVAAARLATIAAERSDLRVVHQVVDSVDEAERWGFHGSPSILVDGEDAFAEAGTAVGLACRVYRTPDGPAGAPTLEQLQAVLGATGPRRGA